MAGVATRESGKEKSSEALVEWRSSEQVENGIPSTSPPYWDSDDDDDGGLKPSELYGKHTWKIDKFSQTNKREIKSNAFEVGGYKFFKNALGFLDDVCCIWYILIYPQGCDVCNHLSLFLCVADHDKLLPGWSHFAQFTIAVVNKDPKKSKYSDTLHRFCKKEHDWGWKKFMELSKVLDGFIDSDNLIIKAQVQVIRERTDRPFRCLDGQYRRELVRVYLTNVEQICRRFVEERRAKLGKLIDDKTRWSSFRAFWLGMDQNSRRRLPREKTESILKVLVKHFFIEKEVTSTLVMDSLYSGLKALKDQHKGKKIKGKHLEIEELPIPIVKMEKDSFLLVDDVLPLLERAAMEPLPPKDEKGPQNRTKDGSLGEEFNKDSIERDERRLTELGRRTIETFILAHVFSKIEVAYQETVALKRQEELIREEEAAWLAEIEQKARRSAADKEKKSRKKQAKQQKRNNRKEKDKGREDKNSSIEQGKIELDIHTAEGKEFSAAEPETKLEKSNAVEDVSDLSDSAECVTETLSEDRSASSVNWDTDTLELHSPIEASSSGVSGLSSVQNGRSVSVVDDSSSTCSSDSVPFIAINSRYNKNQKSHVRVSNHQSKVTSDRADCINAEPSQPSKAVLNRGHHIDASQNAKAVESLSQVADRTGNGAEKHVPKVEETVSLPKSPVAENVNVEVSRGKLSCAVSLPRSPSKNIPTTLPANLESNDNTANNRFLVKKPSPESYSNKQADKSPRPANSPENTPKLATLKPPTQHPMRTTDNKISKPSISAMSRPLSAPVIPGSTPAVSMVPTAQTPPILPRSASSVGRLGPEPPTASAVQSHPPQSYLNATVGSHVLTSSGVNTSFSYSQAPAPLVSTPSFSFGMVNHQHDVLPNGPLWIGSHPQRDLSVDRTSLINDMQSFDLYNSVRRIAQDHTPSGFPVYTSGRQSHLSPDEFPHLDIINDLLDDEHGIGNLSVPNAGYNQGFGDGPRYLGRQASFPGDPSRLGPQTGSCRFEKTHSYRDDGFQPSYVYDTRPDMVPRAGLLPYVNGQIDGSVPGQWQMGGADVAFMSYRNMGNNDPYHGAEYQNPSVGVNGYTYFRPSNGL
ncbi:hypothetical protein CASFOL_005485 [Castilleja foliolosa]|uniref:MATH domain-containing protein n=1 Tax=Castilleja foliolosa TaxID=1961234 RepID=A0ABD3E4T1_9LAMI